MKKSRPGKRISIWSAFQEGTRRVWLHRRIILWLYLVNIVFAAILVYPFRSAVARLSETDLADDFVAGFQIDSFAHYWASYAPVLRSLAFSAIGLGALYLLANIFLTGGVVAALVGDRRVSLRRFLTDAGRYFGRYFRLFLLLAVVTALLVLGYELLLSDFLEDLQKKATTDRASMLYRASGIVLLLACCTFALMVFDYAKIRMVVDRRRSGFLAAVAAFAFSVRRLPRTAALFGLNLVALALLFTLYLLVENQSAGATLVSLLALLAAQQLLVIGRIWMRLSFFASQAAFYQRCGRAPEPDAVSVHPVPPVGTPMDAVR